MFLAVDVGNTHIVLGLFEGEEIRAFWRVASDAARTEDEYRLIFEGLLRGALEAPRVKAAMISSVVPRLATTLETALRPLCETPPRRLTQDLDLGVENRHARPHEVGADRLANTVAGVARYGAPLIVADFGTATTLDVVADDPPAYLGGVIMPGLEMSADSLARRAAQLPRIALQAPERIVGRSTREAMESGILWGAAGAVDRLVQRIRLETGFESCPVVATGGLAPVMQQLADEIQRIDRDLTLHGIRLVWRRNFGDAP